MRFARLTCRGGLVGLMLALVACVHLATSRLSAAEGDDVPAAVEQEVSRLIAELDHPEFARRHQAAARLEELAEEPGLATYLSGRFRRALLSPETSFEVRSQLEPLARALPPAGKPGDEPKPNEAQVVPLLDQLGSDSYAERDSAARRLRAMLDHVELIAPLWLELKRRAASPALSASERHAIKPLLERAREAWLLADPAKVPLPKPTGEQIAGYIDDLAHLVESSPDDGAAYAYAKRELLDLIARDDTRPRVLGMLRDKIAASGDSASDSVLRELVDFARPSLAAEVWSNHHHMTVQYLIIGLPQYNDAGTARKATLFDRIDEQTAHCVSGNSLTPGDYPVGVAIPHPEVGHETMFYLTNLSTPRQRLAYEYHLQRDVPERLQEITTRSLDYFLARATPLNETEVLMLQQLDPRGVSRFIGPYFQAVKDSEFNPPLNDRNMLPTVYGAICAVMSRVGTHEAVPALERLARSGKMAPTHETRVDVAWVAALAIAQRDPWPEVDEWLAGLTDQREPLTSDPDRPPEVGASAAGLLLDRHEVSTRPFGLETAGESVTESFCFVGYRFSSERDRQDVRRWWQKQQNLAAAGRAARLIRNQPPTAAGIEGNSRKEAQR